MHPSVHQHGPGKCPICGMELVPVTVAQQRDGVVMIDEARRQLIGVRTAPLAEAPLRHVFHALGKITYDESSFTDVNLKVSGWITKLLVSQTGQRVTRGQTLFMLYSPDLYSAQQDFLLAQRTGKLEALVHAARKRLSLLGLTDKQIDAIAAGAEPIDTLPIASPATGFVIEKNVVEGASVQASAQLYRIAALDRVWVEADVYEQDLPLVRVGQAAKVTLDYLPGRAYDAKVAYVYPYVESAARTGRVRIELANKELDLRPGMYARVELATDLGARLQVPTSAVVYTGPRRLLFVDVGDGRFAPREIRTGLEADGMYEVLDGVKAGEVVAVSGTFLIAAEARIATTAKYWDEAAPPPVAAPEPPSKLVAPTPPPHNASAKPEPPMPAPTSMPAPEPPPPSAAPAVEYTCPMHPEVRSATPGTCPKCGMALVPVSPRSTAP
jgi:Cu(I)/Ag(I) efflux system membrane fusion protein